MKKLNSLKFWYSLVLMLATVSFTACVDDNDDTEAPFLEVAPTTLTFTEAGTPAEGSQSFFEIKTNRSWKATVQEGADWVTLSKIAGEGNAKVEVSVPGGNHGEALVDIQVANKTGVLFKETVKIISGKVVPVQTIYKETFGSKNVDSKPYVDKYDGWETTGEGAANVTYGGRGASIRATGLANTDSYEGASGPNVVFFGTAPAHLVVNKIALTPEQTNLKLTFGASYSMKGADGNYINTFDPAKFNVSLSADGTAWTPLTYEKNNGDSKKPYWVLATADFTLKAAAAELYIKFEALETSALRLDDVILSTGQGGQEIDLAAGSVQPQPEPDPQAGNYIFYESMGNLDVTTSKPLVTSYEGWAKLGEGATNVTYTCTNKVSVRNSGLDNTGSYEGASGPNTLFFGTEPTSFIVNKIALKPEQTKLQLTFGASYSSRGADGKYDNTFDPAKMTVSLSADGKAWVPVTYTKNDGDTKHPYWVLATADFTLKNAVNELYIKYDAMASSAFRVDDITLKVGNGGQEIDLAAGTTTPEPELPTEGSPINQLIQMQAAGITSLKADMTFEAIVSGDPDVCNASSGTLYIMTEGATTAKEGIVLYGGGANKDAIATKLSLGDKIKVTLRAATAVIGANYGTPQVKGWSLDDIEVISSNNVVTPIKVTADKLAEYMSMPVEVENVTCSAAGVWAQGDKQGMTVGGAELLVYLHKNATAIIGQPKAAVTGSVRGIATVFKGNGQVSPRNLDDLKDFAGQPVVSITAVAPTKLSFPVEGGEQKIVVTLANHQGEAITATGLSADKFTVTVAGTEVTVKALANAGTTAINEQLTIAVEGGNNVVVPVSVAAPAGQGGEQPGAGAYTLIDKVADLKPGVYFMAGYKEIDSKKVDLKPYVYQIWNGKVSGKDQTNATDKSDLITGFYKFEQGNLELRTEAQPEKEHHAAEIEIVEVAGKANTYYIKVGGQYLYSDGGGNRRLYLTDAADAAEWVFADNAKVGGTGMIPTNNGVGLVTANSTYNFLRSYANVANNDAGVFFFKKN